MALSHDPLDELIADLEGALPPASQPSVIDWQMALVGSQMLVDVVLRGTPEDVARVEREPEVRAFLKSFPR